MEIILLEDIGGLGKRGTAVRVADGYARNFLIPRKKAIEAVGNARAVFKDRERARVALEAKQRAEEALKDKSGHIDQAQALAELARAAAQLKLIERLRKIRS